jgi:hypothetical protein
MREKYFDSRQIPEELPKYARQITATFIVAPEVTRGFIQ